MDSQVQAPDCQRGQVVGHSDQGDHPVVGAPYGKAAAADGLQPFLHRGAPEEDLTHPVCRTLRSVTHFFIVNGFLISPIAKKPCQPIASLLVHDKDAGRIHIGEFRPGGEEDASTVREPDARVRQHEVERQISACRISQEMRCGTLAASGVSAGRDAVTQIDQVVVALEAGPGKPFRRFRETVADQGVERTRFTVAGNGGPLP